MAVRRRYRADELLDRWTTAVRTQARAQAAVRAATLALVEAAWREVQDPYDPATVAAFTRAAAAAVRRGRTRAADLTVADVRRVLEDAGVDLRRSGSTPDPEPRGIPIEREMLRPTAHARWLISQGRDVVDALAAGGTRAELMADYDLAMATRDAFTDVVQDVPEVVGWARMLHPELAEGGSCGLCVAAATRIYGKSDLMPLHARCHCLPFAVLAGEEELARRINAQDLMDLYAGMGLTQRQALAAVRFKVEQHGELGPVLVQRGQRFRGPGDLPGSSRGEGGSPVPGPRGGDGGRGDGDAPGTGQPEEEPRLPPSEEARQWPQAGRTSESRPTPPSVEALRASRDIAPDDEPDRHFTATEKETADWLRARGYRLVSVLRTNENRQTTPDALMWAPGAVDPVPVELKAFEPKVRPGRGAPRPLTSPTPNAVSDNLRKARKQARRVVIDGRSRNLSEDAGVEGMEQAIRKYGLDLVEVLFLFNRPDGSVGHLRWP